MALRIWALYQRSRKVSVLLATLIIGTTIHGIVVDGISLRAVWTSSPEPSEQSYLTGCNDKTPRLPALYGSIFYPTLVLEVVFFCMTIWQIIRFGQLSRRTPLMVHIARNGIIFFLFALIAILFAVIGGFFPSTYLAARNSNLIVAVLSMNCSRLILSIRDAFHDVRPSMPPTTESNIRITTIQMRSRLGSAFGELTQLDAADLEPVICEPPNNGWLDPRKKLTCSEDTRLELGELETVPEAEEYEDSGICSRS
ncbi:hypothetical protein BU17DRAFT_97192 [Hysterangium stoloniferum]|nr:hypothetical protein BU17DRAFT_97192 [Hysterangium stoloniferum]